MSTKQSVIQPKMQQRIALRFAIGLLGVAVLLFAWYALRDYLKDPDSGTVDSTGWIAALRQTGSGQQAVIVKQDGTIVDSPGFQADAVDRDVVWRPDGERVYFSSDRDKQSKGYHIYRWNPSPGHEGVDEKSYGTRAQEHPSFQSDGTIQQENFLMVSSGVVVEFNPKTSEAHQILPVQGKSPTKGGGEEGGIGAQFGPEYDHLGNSFREAHWCKNRKYIVGIMRRDEGECLVIQSILPSNDSNLDDGRPHGIAAGDHIDVTVDPKTGNVVYAIIGWQFVDLGDVPPTMIKNGKAVRPVENILGLLNLDDVAKSGPIIASKNGDHAFAQPQVSPDGSQVLAVAGSITADGFKPTDLVQTPLLVGGHTITQLVHGEISAPSWSPDGRKIAYAVVGLTGHSDIGVIDSDGSNNSVITNGKGNFNSPRFSPMLPKSGS